jgi:hypothetical protein
MGEAGRNTTNIIALAEAQIPAPMGPIGPIFTVFAPEFAIGMLRRLVWECAILLSSTTRKPALINLAIGLKV